MKIENAVMVVTGASSGIGRATARAAAAQGPGWSSPRDARTG